MAPPYTFLGKKLKYEKEIYQCLIVGSGAAAFNAAVHLQNKDIKIAIITENRLSGTSRNTGSDKQTYYKIACSGDEKDSPRAMAETLFSGASMDGDIALCEASHSLEEFFHLVSLGVNFPHNAYGEYAGYKTDHDPLQRASSIGPYTSKKMTECLEKEVIAHNTEIIDKTRVIKLLVQELDNNESRAYGILCLQSNGDYIVYYAKNIIFATGGPPGLYSNTVYPESHFGSSGILASEGVVFANMTEWQYGIGSIKFRWNLSGSYQQVIPRYVSVDKDGTEREFLSSYFDNETERDKAVFLKGYQWPFDPAKIQGSSTVDLAIYIEKHIKERRVFLDYTKNPENFNLNNLDITTKEYLEKSSALCPTPIERLMALNMPSYELYKTNGIDLTKEYLEIDVLPQHHNGGVEVNIWWESSIKHLFVIGECAGTHGVHRPGGSALNSGQVGGLRVTTYIYSSTILINDYFDILKLDKKAEESLKTFEKDCLSSTGDNSTSPLILLNKLQAINTKCAAFIRSKAELEKSAEELKLLGEKNINVLENPEAFFKYKEMLLFTRLLHDAILSYIKNGGESRGSYLIVDSMDDIEKCLKGTNIDLSHRDKIINTEYIPEEDKIASKFRKVRPVPSSDNWFEKVWQEYRERRIFNRPS